jgi:hypothetical protein
MRTVIELCGKHFPLFIISLGHYGIGDENASDKELAAMLPCMPIFLAELMTSLQMIADCGKDACIAANGDFFGLLTLALCSVTPIVDDLDGGVRVYPRIQAYILGYRGLSYEKSLDDGKHP